MVSRVMGVLAVSRSVGDAQVYRDAGRDCAVIGRDLAAVVFWAGVWPVFDQYLISVPASLAGISPAVHFPHERPSYEPSPLARRFKSI